MPLRQVTTDSFCCKFHTGEDRIWGEHSGPLAFLRLSVGDLLLFPIAALNTSCLEFDVDFCVVNYHSPQGVCEPEASEGKAHDAWRDEPEYLKEIA